MFSSTSGSKCMKVVANKTPPPNDKSPITSRFEDLILGPVDFVNQLNFIEINIGTHPTSMETPKSVTIVTIFALSTSP